MLQVLRRSGSLHAGSCNTALLRAASALMPAGASPGGFGTIVAQNAWLTVLRTLGTRPWFGGRLMVSRARQMFDAAGEMVDEKMKAQLQQFLQGFLASLHR